MSEKTEAWRRSEDDDKDHFGLVLPFLTENPQFALGFECGMLYEQMHNGHSPIKTSIHALNDEQVIVMAARLGYRLELTPLSEGWAHAVLERK